MSGRRRRASGGRHAGSADHGGIPDAGYADFSLDRPLRTTSATDFWPLARSAARSGDHAIAVRTMRRGPCVTIETALCEHQGMKWWNGVIDS